jgi:RNA polymerase sigma-70 factor (ECF subfamily)
MSTVHRGRFPTTRWTLIARLKSADASEVRLALDEICRQYYYPLYCFVRRRGLEHHDAQDALHDFLAKLLRTGTLADADEARGRLRALLATALSRFLINWRRDNAHRDRELSVDADAAEERYRHERFTEHDTPERLFERKWGHELIQRILRRLGADYAGREKSPLFQALQPVLLAGGSLRGHDAPRLAESLGMTEGALRVALNRLLKDFRALLEAEVLQTVEREEDVDAEIEYLLRVFGKG